MTEKIGDSLRALHAAVHGSCLAAEGRPTVPEMGGLHIAGGPPRPPPPLVRQHVALGANTFAEMTWLRRGTLAHSMAGEPFAAMALRTRSSGVSMAHHS